MVSPKQLIDTDSEETWTDRRDRADLVENGLRRFLSTIEGPAIPATRVLIGQGEDGRAKYNKIPSRPFLRHPDGRAVSPEDHPHKAPWNLSEHQDESEAWSIIPPHPTHDAAQHLLKGLYFCGSWMIWSDDGAGGGAKPEVAFQCGHRLCPRCQPGLADDTRRRIGSACAAVIDGKDKVLALTLTQRACSYPEMPAELAARQKAWNRLIKMHQVAAISDASFRSIEATNNDRRSTGHLHLHGVLIVPKWYLPSHPAWIPKTAERRPAPVVVTEVHPVATGKFKKNGEPITKLVKHQFCEVVFERGGWTSPNEAWVDGWAELWQRAAGLDYLPVTHANIRVGKDGQRAIRQALKYAAKPDKLPRKDPKTGKRPPYSDDVNGEFLAWLALSIKGKRLIECYGRLRSKLAQQAREEEEEKKKGDKKEKKMPVRVYAQKWTRGRHAWNKRRAPTDHGQPGQYETEREIWSPKTWIDVRDKWWDIWPWAPGERDRAIQKEREAAEAAGREWSGPELAEAGFVQMDDFEQWRPGQFTGATATVIGLEAERKRREARAAPPVYELADEDAEILEALGY